MKLYLSSYRVPTPDALFALLPKAPAECKVAIIPNAKDYKLPQERADSIDEVQSDLKKLGFSSDILDLREYDDPEFLFQALSAYDMLWLAGGNTFTLRSEMRRSGLDQVMRSLLDKGIVYCGESAGALVAGLTLEGAEIADDPEAVEERIHEGLGLVNKIIVPHADNAAQLEYVNHMKKQHPDDPKVVYLNDNQALVQND